MKPILITGTNGQVGHELLVNMKQLGNVVAVNRSDMNLADFDSIRRVVRATKPALIVNTAAYTAVDKAESEFDAAMAVNGIAPGILAEESRRIGAAVIHYSTDYVFDGTKAAPYTEEDDPYPLNVYGKTKLAGERAIRAVGVPHLIFRTSWIYGLRGNNFLLTILRLAKERDELKIVDDQIGAPTWCRSISDVTFQVLLALGSRGSGWQDKIAGVSGVYHATAGGQTSWCGFAASILTTATRLQNELPTLIPNPLPRVTAIPTSRYPLPARRPHYSVLANKKLQRVFGVTLPDWQHGLAACLMDRTDAVPGSLFLAKGL